MKVLIFHLNFYYINFNCNILLLVIKIAVLCMVIYMAKVHTYLDCDNLVCFFNRYYYYIYLVYFYFFTLYNDSLRTTLTKLILVIAYNFSWMIT